MAPGSGPEDGGLKEAARGFDVLLEHRLRLAIAVLLSRYDRASFSRLKELTEETDGNLGANLRRLEDEGYVAVRKEFVERRPVTWYALSEKGRRALGRHLEVLDRLIAHARGG